MILSQRLVDLKPLGESAVRLFCGGYNCVDGAQEALQTHPAHDREGEQRSILKISQGVTGMVGGAFFCSEMGGLTVGVGSLAFSGAATVIGIWLCCCGTIRCWSFANRLQGDNPTAVLSRLQSEETGNLKRRTSSRGLYLIQHSQEIPPDQLIAMIRHESINKSILYGIGVAASVLNLAALVAGAVVSLGIWPLVLTSAATLLWASFGVDKWVLPYFNASHMIQFDGRCI